MLRSCLFTACFVYSNVSLLVILAGETPLPPPPRICQIFCLLLKRTLPPLVGPAPQSRNGGVPSRCLGFCPEAIQRELMLLHRSVGRMTKEDSGDNKCSNTDILWSNMRSCHLLVNTSKLHLLRTVIIVILGDNSNIIMA